MVTFKKDEPKEIYNILVNLQKKSVSEIIISDNQSGENINCKSNTYLLKEQANCIASRLKQYCNNY